MRAKRAVTAAWIASIAVLSIAVAVVVCVPFAVALAQVGGIPLFSDPPLGSHCACERGICPLDANGRRCSCGCAKRADAQPLQRLAELAGA